MSTLAPDTVEVWRQYLLSRPAVTAITGDRIGVSLGSPAPSIRLAAAGGDVGPNPGQGVPRIRVECWGTGSQEGRGRVPDDGTASLLARTVLAEIPTEPVATPAGDIANAWAEGFPFASDDPNTNRPRYVVTVRLDTFPS